MDSKAEAFNEDIRNGEADEAAIALKRLATNDMAPPTPEENHRVLRKIDWLLMPLVLPRCCIINRR
jgi:hypothetical protein